MAKAMANVVHHVGHVVIGPLRHHVRHDMISDSQAVNLRSNGYHCAGAIRPGDYVREGMEWDRARNLALETVSLEKKLKGRWTIRYELVT